VDDDDGGVSTNSPLVLTGLTGDIAASDFNNATATLLAPILADQLSFDTAGFAHAHGGTVDISVDIHDPISDSWTTVFGQTLTGTAPYNFDGLEIDFAPQLIDQVRLTSNPGLNQTYHLWNNRLGLAIHTLVNAPMITVNNVAPLISPLNGPDAGASALPGGPFSGVRGQVLAFSALFTDVGALDTHEVSWDFGDGTVLPFQPTTIPGALAPAHTYLAAGTYTLTVSIRDDDGGLTTSGAQVTIHAVQLQTDCCNSNLTALVVGGTTSSDQIVIHPGTEAGTVVVSFAGQSLGQYAPTGKIVVYGQAGDDNIQIAAAILNQAWLYGDAGHDRLFAGNGPSLLIGGEGNDYLLGGGGRDVLVGGNGADQLLGNASDDILIAGFTTYDLRSTAGHAKFWCDVLAEWNSSNTFAQRVQNLKNGAGGGTPQNNGSYLLPNVVDDVMGDEIDFLNGSSAEDWLIFKVGEDKVAGRAEATNDDEVAP
jgi:Ca2+-binding RTX toxin-like protein